MVAGVLEAVNKLEDVNGFMQVEGPAVPHQNRPRPLSV